MGRLVERSLIEEVEIGDADEIAGQVVGPAVVRAHEDLGVAFLGATHCIAAVRTRVQQRLDAAVLLANRQHVVATDGRLEEVAGLWNLALVAQELPRPAEDQVQLALEDLLVAEDASIDLAPLQRHQLVNSVNTDVNRHPDPSPSGEACQPGGGPDRMVFHEPERARTSVTAPASAERRASRASAGWLRSSCAIRRTRAVGSP